MNQKSVKVKPSFVAQIRLASKLYSAQLLRPAPLQKLNCDWPTFQPMAIPLRKQCSFV